MASMTEQITKQELRNLQIKDKILFIFHIFAFIFCIYSGNVLFKRILLYSVFVLIAFYLRYIIYNAYHNYPIDLTIDRKLIFLIILPILFDLSVSIMFIHIFERFGMTVPTPLKGGLILIVAFIYHNIKRIGEPCGFFTVD